MIDVIIPAHEKDMDTLDLCIEYIKTNSINQINNIYVISKNELTKNAKWIPESRWEFSKKDIAQYIGYHQRTGWYYQQLLKLTVFNNIDSLEDNVLICDSDTMFIRPVRFVEEDGTICLSMSYDTPTGVYIPYFEFMEKLISGLTRQTEYAGVCHHMIVNRSIVSSLQKTVEDTHQERFWKVCMGLIISEYKSSNVTTKQFLETGEGWGRISEYELLFNYYLKYFNDNIKLRPLKQILAYKGVLGYEGENILTNTNSRSNLDGHLPILNPSLEKAFKFDSAKDAIINTINHIKKTEWETVTFANHTRIGTKKHNKECLEESQTLKRKNQQ